jgi:23S rRNA pseudouridine2605 synthase
MTRSHDNRRRRRPRGFAGEPHLAASHEAAAPQGVRLQKAMAQAGIGSRRHCEELIAAGRVEVDGQTVSELGTKVRAGQEIRVDSVPLSRPQHVYFLVNKPTGVVSTNFDPSGRTRVIDLLPPLRERLFTVGRLDMSSEGLILVTNDGELANRLAHPRYRVEKTYHVVVAGTPEREVLATLCRGVHLAEGLARATSVRVCKMLKQSTLLEIVLSEGKNREIRRILAKVGHKVLRLKRVAIGPLRLGNLAPGEVRRLTPDEIRSLRNARPGRRHRAIKVRQRRASGRVESPQVIGAAAHVHDRGARPTTSRRRRGRRR